MPYTQDFAVFDAEAGRWSAGEICRLDIQRQEVSVEYEGRVKTVAFLHNGSTSNSAC